MSKYCNGIWHPELATRSSGLPVMNKDVFATFPQFLLYLQTIKKWIMTERKKLDSQVTIDLFRLTHKKKEKR